MKSKFYFSVSSSSAAVEAVTFLDILMRLDRKSSHVIFYSWNKSRKLKCWQMISNYHTIQGCFRASFAVILLSGFFSRRPSRKWKTTGSQAMPAASFWDMIYSNGFLLIMFKMTSFWLSLNESKIKWDN